MSSPCYAYLVCSFGFLCNFAPGICSKSLLKSPWLQLSIFPPSDTANFRTKDCFIVLYF
jgi:hypothetical protein